jgi:hypothetical protein
VLGHERIQRRRLVGKVCGDVGKELTSMVPQPSGDQPDRQRQPTTSGQDLPGSVAVLASMLADQLDEQPLCLVPPQDVE